MADYGVNIKVKVQGQNNAKQLGEQVREIVSGLEAADRAFTRFSNNLKSFDQRRAQRKINEELDKTAQKYRELDRLQRQLLANDNSAIKAAERRAKIEEHISKNISAGRARQRSAFLLGNPNQYPSGANQPFAPDPMVAIRKQRDAEAKFAREIFNMEQDFNRKINTTEIDLLQDKIKREMDAQQEIFNNAIRLNKKAADDFDRRLARATRDRSEATRLTGQTSSIGGAVGIPGSPAALAAAARAQRIRSAQGSALIGGAFPLLFGQGLGAAAGGAAGGFGGGMIGGEFGFGLSLVGTQIGSMIDQLAQKAIDLGKALNPLTADTQVILEAVGRADTEFASLVKELEAAGESARALELATQELEAVVGADGVEALEVFSNRMSNLQNTFAAFITFVSARLAQAINDLTGETPFVQKVRSRTEAVSRARDSKDPEIIAAVKALDEMEGFGVDPKDRIAQQEKIVDLLNNGTKAQKEALRLRQLDVKLGKDQARLIDQSTQLTALNTELVALGEDKHTAQGVALQKNIASQIRSNSIEKAYKDFAEDNLTLAGLRATLRGVEADFAEQVATIDANAARFTTKQDEKRQRAIENRIEAVDREIKQTEKAFNRADNQLNDIINKNKDKVAFEKEYARLIEEGSTPAAAKQAIELQKQLKQLDRTYDKLIDRLDVEVASLKASIAKARAEGATEDALKGQLDALAEIERKIAGLEGKKEGAEGAINEALAPKSDRKTLQEYLTELQGELNKLMNPANQLIGLAETLGGAFSESFKGIVSGSMSAREALANLFQRTADHFLDMAAQMIAAQLKMQAVNLFMSFFPSSHTPIPGSMPQMKPGAVVTPTGFQGQFDGFAANGGPVTGGKSYIVGERGPELFTPGVSGGITPNHAMGGASVVVNVDASGTEVQGNQGNADQLGRLIGQAVQAELIKQKRPGGLLTR